MIVDFLNALDSVLYYPILIIVLAAGGLYFSFRTRFLQIRLFKEACRLVIEPPVESEGKAVSSFQALIVSTASRVGTGNIVGVSTAICFGGPGACFWMWLMCIIGAASAFFESTLAQVFKRRHPDGSYYGGPAYYIEKALKHKIFSILFSVFLILTYAFGFNMLASYNLQSTFEAYSFYNSHTPIIIGLILAVIVAYCVFGGGQRIVHITSVLVPVMGIGYVIISLIVIFAHITHIPAMFAMIFKNAFDFHAIFGGFAGSCVVYGIKRGLYSNEAGVGSAPNASASAAVSHPAKQGLVQTVSVYIDTMLLCTATALMCLASGVDFNAEVAGAPYVQNAISTVFGAVGPVFITIAMLLFAFTTLLGNLYYCDNALAYLNGKKLPSKTFMNIFYVFCVAAIFIGAQIPMDAAWAIADITMAGMTLINIPACLALSGIVLKVLKDYETKKKAGLDPSFTISDIDLEDTTDITCWD